MRAGTPVGARVGALAGVLARRAVKTVAGAADLLVRPAPGVVVLAYHRVGAGTGSSVDLPPSLFDEQMAWLAAECSPVTLSSALESLHRSGAPAGDLVVVTFDDGTADVVDVALPVLERYRIPAVLYVATGFVGASQPLPGWGLPLSWSALSDAMTTGLLTIGSHTHAHLVLAGVEQRSVADDLDRSVEEIERHLGVRALDFAYPKAVWGGPGAEREIRSRFRSAALAGGRANPYGSADPYRLWRTPIQVEDGMGWFMRKARGGLALEGWARGRLDRMRYRGARV